MTTTRRPDPCHYSPTHHQRVTRQHTQTCTTNQCDGCAPCTAPHCLICGTRHTNNDHPDTCPRCIHTIRNDLTDIRTAYRDLSREALDAGNDGHLAAAAPIPGGTAQILIGPSVRLDLLKITSRGLEDHHRHDPIPPLAILAQWEDIYRHWLDHTPGRRATVGAALTYLDGQLDYLANHATTPGAPDFLEFTRQIRRIRDRLERTLHDEREPEIGVPCFECGEKLVRRFRRPVRCRHSTPGRVAFRQALTVSAGAQDHLRALASYGLEPRQPEITATVVSTQLLAEARVPCGECARDGQGGISNPDVGRSWECPGCRKKYDPGEYARAVRLSLTDRGADGDGWTQVTMAADAASTLTGHLIPASTVRKWMDRGKVASLCLWQAGVPWGVRLVFWPDVADLALEAVERAVRAEERRRQREARHAAEVAS